MFGYQYVLRVQQILGFAVRPEDLEDFEIE